MTDISCSGFRIQIVRRAVGESGQSDRRLRQFSQPTIESTALTPQQETDVLLLRLDSWREGQSAGPLIRWAAAVLRGRR